MLSIIVAMDENGAIGKDGGLLCHLPADLAHFKEVTSGHTVVMGSNTYLSLPKRPLPNRRNIVLSSKEDRAFEGAEVVHSTEELFSKVDCENEEVFIIGGGRVYQEFLPLVDCMYVTKIYHSWSDADTFFPVTEIDRSEWSESVFIGHFADDKNPYDYAFIQYNRIVP